LRKLVALTSTAFLTAALAGCSSAPAVSPVSNDCKPQHPGLTTVTAGQLTASTPIFPPFTQVEGGKMTGVEGEILEQVASMECLALKPQPLDTASVISSAQNGRVDIAAGNWYCTAERAKTLALAGPIYGDQMGILTKQGVGKLSELEGKVVGTVDGYHWDGEFKAIYGSELKLYPNPTALYSDFKAGRIDAAIDSYGSASYANLQNGSQWVVKVPEPDQRVAASTSPAQACFPLAKRNEALAKAVIGDIQKLRSDGTLAKILEKNGLDASAANVSKLNLIG
jgi:polar amino acid transport system substrate-binding protein